MSLNSTNLLSPPFSMSKGEQERVSEKPTHQSCLCFLPANLQMFEVRFQNQRKFHRFHRTNLNLAIYHVILQMSQQEGKIHRMVLNLIIYHVIL